MDPWTIPEFRTGLIIGTFTALAIGIAVWPLGRHRPVPWLGLLVAGAGLVAIAADGSVPLTVVVGVTGLAVVGARARSVGYDLATTAALALPFAWLLGFYGGVPGATWIRLLVVVVASVGGVLVASTDQRWRRDAVGPGLFLLTVTGVYFTVPDTEEVAALLGVAVPLTLLGWPLRRARLGPAGAMAATGLLCWVAAIGGRGRPSSIVGAVACLALLAGVAAASRSDLRVRASRRLRPSTVAGLAIVQLALVFVGSRVAGLRHDLVEATVLAIAVLAVSLVVGTVIDQRGALVAEVRRGRRESGRRA